MALFGSSGHIQAHFAAAARGDDGISRHIRGFVDGTRWHITDKIAGDLRTF
jgi:hypothetical protein